MRYISSDKKTNIYGTIWYPKVQPKGIIHVIHGITEYIGRYEEFAAYFNDKGYIVCGIDVIGHGRSLQNNNIKGYFGTEGSFKYVVADVLNCYKLMKEEYPDIPYFLLGFSMGSFIVRTLLLEEGRNLNIDGCFLLGTGSQPLAVLKTIRYIVRHNCNKVGEENSSNMVQMFAFDNYNKQFSNPRTNSDWLLKDVEELDKYINDPMCLDKISSGLFRELLSGMIFSCNKKNKTDVDYPIYLLSGAEDAVGDNGKGIDKTKDIMIKQGFKKIEIRLFNEMRHDILHETNRKEVFEFIEKNIMQITK